MPFPYKPAAKDAPHGAPPARPFSKKRARSRKQRQAAPAQKALMQSGRTLSGGGR
jgi:hypothetical protein